jgi:hypothetical protein
VHWASSLRTGAASAAEVPLGEPFHRLAKRFSCDGFQLDDAMMGRYAEHVGASLACIVEACAEAKQTAFCLATDSTTKRAEAQPWRLAAGQAVLERYDRVFATGGEPPTGGKLLPAKQRQIATARPKRRHEKPATNCSYG